MNKMLALACKDLRLLLRDKAGFTFVFVFPLVYAIFFGSVFAGQDGPSAIRVTVVDEDDTDDSRAFITALAELEGLEITPAADRAEAEDLVRRGKRAAYVTIPAGFAETRRRMFSGGTSSLEIGFDPSRRAEAGMLEGLLMQQMFGGMSEAFQDPAAIQETIREDRQRILADTELGTAQKAIWSTFLSSLDTFLGTIPTGDDLDGDGDDGSGGGWQPVSVTSHEVTAARRELPNSFAIAFPQAISWALIGTAAAFGISLVTERTEGTLLRLHAAPLSRRQVLGGKALACLATTLAVSTTLLLVARLAFDVRPNSWALLAVAVISACLCFVGIMMLLSVIGRTQASASGIGWAIMLVMAMLGGGMVPLAFMPGFMQPLSNVSPVKWAIWTMEGAIWRGLDPSELASGYMILCGIGLVAFLAGARMFRRLAW